MHWVHHLRRIQCQDCRGHRCSDPTPRRAPLSLVPCLMTMILRVRFPTKGNSLFSPVCWPAAGTDSEHLSMSNASRSISTKSATCMASKMNNITIKGKFGIEDELLYLRKILGLYKFLGSSYGRRMVGCLYHLHLHTLAVRSSAIIKCHNNNNLKLFRMFKWQDPLLLAIGVHPHNISKSSSDPKSSQLSFKAGFAAQWRCWV